jgi:hypothetical protein
VAMTPEGRVKNTIKKILKDYKVVYAMPATGGFGKSGVSDFLVCHRGYFISIEAKSGSSQPTALQKKWLKEVAEAGGWGLVINEDNMDEITDLFDSIDEVDDAITRLH